MRVYEEMICGTARLQCYICGESPEMPNYVREAMLVLPGGAYGVCSEREAEPVVKRYLAEGMNVFCLYYSVGTAAAGFRPLVEASYAIKYIRDNAKEFNVDKNKVYAVGFSAGGHLCASLGTFWNAPWLREKIPDIPEGMNKPNGTILAYPVISAVEQSHFPSFQTIIGKADPTREELERYSVELHAGKDSSPAFIWATSDDQLVPIINSVRLADKLAQQGISFELHIWQHGPHGMSVAEEETSVSIPAYINEEVAKWVKMSVKWLRQL